MIPTRVVLALGAAFFAGAVQAQAPARPASPAPQQVAAEPCAKERAHAAAEESTPGFLRDLMREELAACLAASQPAGTTTTAGVGR